MSLFLAWFGSALPSCCVCCCDCACPAGGEDWGIASADPESSSAPPAPSNHCFRCDCAMCVFLLVGCGKVTPGRLHGGGVLQPTSATVDTQGGSSTGVARHAHARHGAAWPGTDGACTRRPDPPPQTSTLRRQWMLPSGALNQAAFSSEIRWMSPSRFISGRPSCSKRTPRSPSAFTSDSRASPTVHVTEVAWLVPAKVER